MRLPILPINGFRMNELTVVDKANEWRRMKAVEKFATLHFEITMSTTLRNMPGDSSGRLQAFPHIRSPFAIPTPVTRKAAENLTFFSLDL